MKLDKKNKQLLDLLYLDSRMSLTELGKKLKLSPSAVDHRLTQLKEAGVISLLFADVNLTKLGLKSYRMYFKFDVFDKQTEEGINRLFNEYKRTVWGAICDGEYDVIWRICAEDEWEVERALSIMLERFGTKIVEKTVVTTTYQTYFSWNKAFETERHKPFPLEKMIKPEYVDEIDMRILSILYANARATTVEISEATDLTPDAIQYRLKRLREQEYILGNTAWFDARKLGFNYYKLMIGFRGVTEKGEKEFLEFCSEHDAVIYLNKVIGTWDIEVDILVANNTELHSFIQEIKSKFGHILGKNEYLAVVEEQMLNPLR